MKLVLLSGGSGKRLWPLSNDSRSKQFLKVLTSPDNEPESMVQRVWRQLEAAGLQNFAHIATGKGQLDVLQSQIGYEVPVIVEPERRDTYPAIALAATYLYSIKDVELNEVIAILPVDPYVEDHFFETIKRLESIVHLSGADVALMGVKPTYPSEKYGYIVPEHDQASLSSMEYVTVGHFTEKPAEDKAKELIDQQALWNCGVFAFKLGYIIDHLHSQGLPIHYEELLKQYHRLPKISFDYAIVEKAANIAAVSYDGYWKDLGTWNTLTEEMASKQIGKGIITMDCINTHLVNELDLPVTILGVSNAVVAVSPDGILVSQKESSPRIKDALKQMDDQRPMYEERRWGWYKVLDYSKLPQGGEVLTKRIHIHADKNVSYQLHFKRSEVWTIISGAGDFLLNDKMTRVKTGDVLRIPVGSKHSIRALEDLEFIEVQQGTELVEDDILRFATSWEEILQSYVGR
ncbi:mannose-1-phosphate guanylyltransferase [Paenibacillus timonensis]|uniref:Sugar phosphate nucleotidyltransferase n=1 Tax=Paenibacillus timonensis TaxID=225915 RepID=A0ABW3SB82_9BACL|nr:MULTISPECIES: sugar phosphate nucleotidyltransferase [Paenibacillus]MCH1640109.1 mannose-1-phosphate guanylyltransferase [Paenibacillus timonensis]MDU2243289.1 sugar phosphate nucleotidyltransferase [Paenibacillus sp.]